MGRFLNLFSKGETCQLLVNLEGKHVSRYQSFKSFLEHNHGALSLIAELEQMVYSNRPFSLVEVRKKVQDLSAEVKDLLDAFHDLSERKYASLSDVFEKLNDRLALELNPKMFYPAQDLVLLFEELTPEKRTMTGAKAANLSAIKTELRLPVPDGFAVTAVAY